MHPNYLLPEIFAGENFTDKRIYPGIIERTTPHLLSRTILKYYYILLLHIKGMYVRDIQRNCSNIDYDSLL